MLYLPPLWEGLVMISVNCHYLDLLNVTVFAKTLYVCMQIWPIFQDLKSFNSVSTQHNVINIFSLIATI